MKFYIKYCLIAWWILFTFFCYSQSKLQLRSDLSSNDTIKSEVIPFSIKPKELDNFFFKRPQLLYLKDPKNISNTFIYDPQTKTYILNRKMGRFDYRIPQVLSFDEYFSYIDQKSRSDFWKSNNTKGYGRGKDGIIPPMYIGGNVFENVFGSNFIDIRPQGSAEITFGFLQNNRKDETLDVKRRKTTSFDFNEKIQMSVTAKIGDKIEFKTNYNTESTFDFENNLALKYVGNEDEIIQLIEGGDVNFTLPTTLINGSQGLFGVKTKLKFGNTTITGVFSQQKSETSSVTVQGGAQKNKFNLTALDYEENRHFFLAQYFREEVPGDGGKPSNRYNEALKELPIINSNINITRIEVWVTNIGAAVNENRNIIAFTDLGEFNPFEPALNKVASNNLPSNEANDLIQRLDEAKVRDINAVNQYLQGDPLGVGSFGYFNAGDDFEKIESARKLNPSEFSFNSKLGFISLNTGINPDQTLAVAFQYTVIGDNKVYQVGEFSDQGITSPKSLIVKLLKSSSVNTKNPLWDLMMKNVYSIRAYQVNQEDFIFNVLYSGNEKGVPTAYFTEGSEDIVGVPLIRLLGMDRLDPQKNPPGDGIFDFIDGAATNGGTINAVNGRIFFPVLEPFGLDLRKLFDDQSLANKYAYDSLYTQTKSKAEQYPEKNKFILEGFFKSATSNEISLNAFNVPQGSVNVTAGGIPLTENVDYTVDYTLGRVRIINEGILNSGTPIRISSESNTMFNVQTKRYMGMHINHNLNDNINFGATIINLNERPLTQKTNYGEDPISNTIWGFNFNYEKNSRLLTKLVDKLPFVETNTPSTITIDGEFAQFMPGHSAVVGETGISYVDDFEGSKSTINLKYFSSWMLASTPQGQYNLFPEAAPGTGLNYGKNRARLAWYIIDPLFYDRNSNLRPANITEEELSKHTVRQVLETEVFPNKDVPNGIPTNISVLNLAYYPSEKGQYNYDVNPVPNMTAGMNSIGKLNEPESRWGGVMRKIESTDFEAANVEYIEFWLMDPFVEGQSNNKGKLYFNLGDISEDILRDSRKSFENGLPNSSIVVDVDTTIWGRVPKIQSLVESFDNTAGSRIFQDVGYDGLSTADEIKFFSDSETNNYLIDLESTFGETSAAYTMALKDPANDNYHYFRGTDYDENNKYSSILERYKYFNNPEGNSPTSDINPESYPTSATAMPNIEDINRDNTLSEAERYYQYEIELDPAKMNVGQNYIADIYEAQTHQLPDGSVKNIKWYQFKIPINSPDEVIGSIEDFKSIRFLRMFMKGFKKPTVLRFATLELVRGEWRRYQNSLLQPDENVPASSSENTTFDISAVNIEENGRRVPIPYVIPPGIERETNIATTNIVRRNEQSMVLKVGNLVDGDSRGAFKTSNFDFRQYKELKMYVHAEKANEFENVEDGDLTLFIRMGSDFNENYYEYEVPLKLTPWGTSNAEPDLIWPEENTVNINLEELVQVKQNRNVAMRQPNSSVSSNSPYVVSLEGRRVTILGVPSISDVKAILIGIRNPKQLSFTGNDDGLSKSAEVWVNELRLSDYRSSGGWATRARLSANLADLGRVILSGSHSTPGFGSIEQKVNETQKEKITNFDVSTDVEFGKFFSENSGIRIPVHFDVSHSTITPEFNPLDPDIKLSDELNSLTSNAEKDSLRMKVEDYVFRKNINLMNVRKEKTNSKKPKIYDIENFNFSYAYSEVLARNIDVELDERKTYRGGIVYNFRHNPKPIEPLKKVKALNKPYLKIIKDFNFYLTPKILFFSTDMYREHNSRKLRNKSSGDVPIETYYAKKWDWNRDYNIKYDLTRSINIDFKARATAYIDEPQGNPDKGTSEYNAYRKAVWDEIKGFGTINRYNQSITVNYNLPINKIPILSWINSQFRYLGTYNWQASSKSTQERFGNQIENSRQIQWNGSLVFTQLYNKFPFLRKLTLQNRRKSSRTRNRKNENYADDQSKGKNRAIKNIALNLITSIKRASFNYTKTEGTFLPGFLPEPGFLGNSRNYTPDENVFGNSPYFGNTYPTSLAPGIGFVFGDQRDIRNDAIRNGWLSPDTLLNQAYATKRTTNFSARVSIEPIPNLKIELTADRAYSLNHREYFRANSLGEFNSYAPVDQGSFSMSFIALGTAFGNEINDVSLAFEDMKSNRLIIANRLAENNPNWNGEFFPIDTIVVNGIQKIITYPVGYGPSSQDVLMYSFLSAYTGKNPESFNLKMFPKIPIPNWRITYSGLTRIQILGDLFNNITISHAYRASYNVGSFISNVEREMISGYPAAIYAEDKNYIPEYDITMVSISEQFIPLISIDMLMKNNFSTKVELKKSRMLSFSFANNQLTEVKSDEVVVGLGYRIKDVNLGFKTVSGNNGFSSKVKSDLNLKADFSLRRNKTTLRRIDELINQISAGQEIMSINLSADYLVSRKFNLRMYFDKVINNPFVSSQYPNSTTTGGFSLRFFLN